MLITSHCILIIPYKILILALLLKPANPVTDLVQRAENILWEKTEYRDQINPNPAITQHCSNVQMFVVV